jgi:hypothetical protein
VSDPDHQRQHVRCTALLRQECICSSDSCAYLLEETADVLHAFLIRRIAEMAPPPLFENQAGTDLRERFTSTCVSDFGTPFDAAPMSVPVKGDGKTPRLSISLRQGADQRGCAPCGGWLALHDRNIGSPRVAAIWKAAFREWADSQAQGLSVPGAFTHVYLAAFDAASAMLRAAGYRIHGTVGGHHYNTFCAAGALGDAALEEIVVDAECPRRTAHCSLRCR